MLLWACEYLLVCAVCLQLILKWYLCLLFTDPDFQVHVRKSSPNQHPTWTELTCHSNCQLPVDPSYIWYKNGQLMEGNKVHLHLHSIYPEDEYSCALSGYESFRSPSVCEFSLQCSTNTSSANFDTNSLQQVRPSFASFSSFHLYFVLLST